MSIVGNIWCSQCEEWRRARDYKEITGQIHRDEAGQKWSQEVTGSRSWVQRSVARQTWPQHSSGENHGLGPELKCR